MALALTPDVVVMDINMPGLNGIDATRGILDESEDINILVMTMHDDDEAVFAAIRAGARGYQLKGAAQDETLRAIRSDRERRSNLRPGDRRPAPALPRHATRQKPQPRVSAADRPRTRDPRTPRAAQDQRRDSGRTLPEPKDRPQLRLGHLRETPGRRPRRGRTPRPHSRPRRPRNRWALTMMALARTRSRRHERGLFEALPHWLGTVRVENSHKFAVRCEDRGPQGGLGCDSIAARRPRRYSSRRQ